MPPGKVLPQFSAVSRTLPGNRLNRRIMSKKYKVLGRSFVGILYLVQKGKCFYCGSNMDSQPNSLGNVTGWTREHVWPHCAGGMNEGNIVLSCLECNTEKSARRPLLIDVARTAAIWGLAELEIFKLGKIVEYKNGRKPFIKNLGPLARPRIETKLCTNLGDLLRAAGFAPVAE